MTKPLIDHIKDFSLRNVLNKDFHLFRNGSVSRLETGCTAGVNPKDPDFRMALFSTVCQFDGELRVPTRNLVCLRARTLIAKLATYPTPPSPDNAIRVCQVGNEKICRCILSTSPLQSTKSLSRLNGMISGSFVFGLGGGSGCFKEDALAIYGATSKSRATLTTRKMNVDISRTLANLKTTVVVSETTIIVDRHRKRV